MSKLVATLATTTVVFAGSTAWLGWRLHQLRMAEVASVIPAKTREVGTIALSQDAAATSTSRPFDAGAQAPLAGAAATSASAPEGNDPAVRSESEHEAMRSYARQILARLADPAQRADIVRANRSRLDAQFSRLKEQLKLSDEVYDQMLGLMSDRYISEEERHSRCALDPACDIDHFGMQLDATAEIEALLGPGKMQAFTQYRDAGVERQMVAQLRSRLNDANYLRDSDADRLVTAMMGESKRIQDEMQAAGIELTGIGGPTGMLWYNNVGTPEQRLASARRNAERIRESAASVLNAEQMRVFTQMQEETIDSVASVLNRDAK